ncbi:MAG: cation:proton antiporter [Chloroflexota bacterium]|nr:cation:proton antiporter [Chloroflexota bacterium]
MIFTIWYVVVGALLILMALGGSVLRRLPLTTSLLYLAVGFALGPRGAGLFNLDPLDGAVLLERLTEVAVVVSLFTAGLKLRVAWTDARWRLPLRLAFGSMTVTVGLIAVAGVIGLGLEPGAAILLGAILAPTDPVLASDVQVTEAGDQDRLRFSLTGEAGLNDGTAFPFVMLGLGLLGLHDLGDGGWRWVTVDVVWSVIGGLVIGGVLGTLIGELVLYLRRKHKEAVGLDDFLALGLIALSYGVALLAHSYGFLAVFAAGLALRRIEQRAAEANGGAEEPDAAVAQAAVTGKEEEVATKPETAPAYMARAVLGFNEQLERIGEVTVVVLVGGMLSLRDLPPAALWFVPLLFLAIRPAAVVVGLLGSATSWGQRGLISWFGIRGIGSVYYLSYAVAHGLEEPVGRQLIALTLTTVAVSVVIHGVSVTALMERYGQQVDVHEQEAARVT